MKIKIVMLIISILSSSLYTMEHNPPQVQEVNHFDSVPDDIVRDIFKHALPNIMKNHKNTIMNDPHYIINDEFGTLSIDTNNVELRAIENDLTQYASLERVCKRFKHVLATGELIDKAGTIILPSIHTRVLNFLSKRNIFPGRFKEEKIEKKENNISFLDRALNIASAPLSFVFDKLGFKDHGDNYLGYP